MDPQGANYTKLKYQADRWMTETVHNGAVTRSINHSTTRAKPIKVPLNKDRASTDAMKIHAEEFALSPEHTCSQCNSGANKSLNLLDRWRILRSWLSDGFEGSKARRTKKLISRWRGTVSNQGNVITQVKPIEEKNGKATMKRVLTYFVVEETLWSRGRPSLWDAVPENELNGTLERSPVELLRLWTAGSSGLGVSISGRRVTPQGRRLYGVEGKTQKGEKKTNYTKGTD